MSNIMILQRFKTEKFKRFSNQSGPMMILLSGLMLTGFNLVGILSLKQIISITGLFFPLIVRSPIAAIVTSVNNLAHERKMTKAIFMILAISCGAAIGAEIGYFLLSHSLFYIPWIRGFINACRLSPILISIGMLTGILRSHATDNIQARSGFYLAMLASVILLFLPIEIPLIVEVVFICSASLAFITSIVAKQSLRAFYKYQYGHSNADGYQMDKTEGEQQIFITQQAIKFNVSEGAFKDLINYCRKKIQDIKQEASFDEKLDHESPDQAKTNSFKDIYYGLMNPKSSAEDTAAIKTLLLSSTISDISTPSPLLSAINLPSKEFLRSDLFLRTVYHQTNVYPGIEDVYITPFMHS